MIHIKESISAIGRHEEAIADYTKAIEVNSMIANAYNNRGESYRKKGQFDQLCIASDLYESEGFKTGIRMG